MAADKKPGKKHDALVDDLTKQVKKLTKRLEVVEKERDALARQVTKQQARAKAAVAAAEKNAKKAIAKAKAKYGAQSSKAVTFIEDHAPIDVPDVVEKALGADTPDETWTVTRLRAEARARGVAGYSRMSKAQLLAAF